MKGNAMTPHPWYREPWPWAIMAGPAIVVVAGIVTTVLAITSFDGLVADDYYKQGLGINRLIAREAAAKRLGISAGVAFGADRSRVRMVLAPVAAPATPRLAITHPTLRSEDREVVLAMTAPGVYEGAMRAPRPGRYQLRVEDGDGRWRLSGAWSTRDDAVRLVP
jgi:hypothetical protein